MQMVQMLKTNQILRSNPSKVAVCALIRCGDMYLAVSRKDNSEDFGLPGGKVDPGENLEQALIREVLEETGYHVRVDINQPYYVNGDDSGYTVYTFICTLAPQPYQPVAADETGQVRFVTQDQLTNNNTFAFYNSDLFAWFSDIKNG